MKVSYLGARFALKVRGAAVINSKVDKTSHIGSGTNFVSSEIGAMSYCGHDCGIIQCKIGKFCSIANYVIIGGDEHPVDWVSTSPAFYDGGGMKIKLSHHKRTERKTTIIGNDVWIGNGSFIKQGVTIGTGAVIGMGSVVTRDVEPYDIVAGCPAKSIRKRFDDITIEKLLQSE